MSRSLFLCLVLFSLASAQSNKQPTPPPNQSPPHSDPAPPPSAQRKKQDVQGAGDSSGPSSSSKDEAIDLTAPKDDDQGHPGSAAAVREAEDEAGLYEGDEIGGIQEFKPWNPHKADKDVEVGDFYFKRKNYKAALDRYREALYYKDNDAVATFKLAVCEEKVGDLEEARKAYKGYLKILPDGPFAEESRRGLERLKLQNTTEGAAPEKNPAQQ